MSTGGPWDADPSYYAKLEGKALMCSQGGVPFNKDFLDAKDEEISRLTAEVEELKKVRGNYREANANDNATIHRLHTENERLRTERDALQEKYDAVCEEHSEQVDAWCELKIERDALRDALQEIVDHYPDDGEPPPYIYGRLQLQEIAEAALTASAVVKDSPTLPRNGPLDALKTTELSEAET